MKTSGLCGGEEMLLRIGQRNHPKTIPVSIPKKHFAKWLQTESKLAKLNIWIGFTKFVLTLGTIAGLTVYIGNQFPEALKHMPAVIVTIGSLAGIAVGIGKYKNRRRDDD